ncbi:rhomboid family intramembrane serine protease [Streptomyces sp. GC420]|uniref:rhomboid family intramembrane serine protease n=1 Tax=Streptomyces sp. GC420 TaxID=2697568 RepID=UPI001414EA5C|nr:rhomboid family intramembrane serine protease [Streptomyces sp. GC420]NBM19129.1 rhomboid family intramembrane serine protease [Streptomyces sp. GC420]
MDASPAPRVTTCYRHPAYETYVRCTRCDRFICPSCMREAPVGHQCVECVKEGARSVRRPRTVFGGRISAVPAVTYALMTLNILAYLAELLRPALVDDFGAVGHGLVGPDGARYLFDGEAYPGYGAEGIAYGEWYRLITSAFLHLPPGDGYFGVLHVLMNMYCLWQLGPAVESVLGRSRFLGLYLLSALGGSVLVYLISPQELVVGASGALFGLAGAYYVISRRLGHDLRAANRFLMIFLVWMLLSARFTSWEGHLGGLLAGGALTLAYAYAPAKRRTLLHLGAGAAMLALLVVLVLARTQQLTA